MPFCPVHSYARKRCTWRCAKKRRQLTLVEKELRQYWYDRRRGVGSLTPHEYARRYGGLILMVDRSCARCGLPIVEKNRKRYCSDACADSAARDRIKLRKAQSQARVWYRYYPKAPS